MTGLPSPVPAQTNKTSTSTETHVVKDFLGFLDQQFFLRHKKLFGWEIKCGNISCESYRHFINFTLFSREVLVGYETLPTFHLSYRSLKLPVEPTRMERLKNESDAPQKNHIL